MCGGCQTYGFITSAATCDADTHAAYKALYLIYPEVFIKRQPPASQLPQVTGKVTEMRVKAEGKIVSLHCASSYIVSGQAMGSHYLNGIMLFMDYWDILW